MTSLCGVTKLESDSTFLLDDVSLTLLLSLASLRIRGLLFFGSEVRVCLGEV